jgi:hypothetical protein
MVGLLIQSVSFIAQSGPETPATKERREAFTTEDTDRHGIGTMPLSEFVWMGPMRYTGL